MPFRGSFSLQEHQIILSIVYHPVGLCNNGVLKNFSKFTGVTGSIKMERRAKMSYNSRL